MKLKQKSSARMKRRYLLIDARSKKEVESIILDYLGILGWARCSPNFVSSAKNPDKIILAVERKSLTNIRAAFEISESKAKILRVSGTLKGLNK